MQRPIAPLTLACLLLLFGFGTPAPLSAQPSIDGLSTDEATIGTFFDITGNDFGTKPKVFLAQDGQKAKKTVLKLRASADDGKLQTLTVEVRKALLGTFQVGVKPKGGNSVFSASTLEIVPPVIVSVVPDTASPGDTVTVRVENAGSGKLRAEIFKKAKVLGATPVAADGDLSELTDVQVRVPNVPNGTYNVKLSNKLGAATAKAALTVTNGVGCPGKPRAALLIDGKLFKTKKVTATEITDGLLITAKRGGNNSRTIRVVLPFDPDTDPVPQTYTLAPASIEYVESSGSVDTGTWATSSGDGFKVIVNALQCETLILTVCGPLTDSLVDGGGSLPFEGTIIARLPKPAVAPQGCESMFGQVGGVAFLADIVLASYLPSFTTTLIAGLDTPLNAQVSMDLVYDAFTQDAVVFDVIGPTAMRLFLFTDNNEDFFAFAPVPGTPGSSVIVEILDNDGSCITGLFSGSVKQPTTGEVRTFNTFHFEAPLEIVN